LEAAAEADRREEADDAEDDRRNDETTRPPTPLMDECARALHALPLKKI